MSLPWVVITDPFESQDILLRRTKEFDRASFFGEVLGGLLPHQHIQFQSTDARFKDNRNLINHLMAPSFINEVSAPEVYSSVCTLMKLWQVKCDTAQGRPFSAHHDITYAALDSIFASSFGLAEADSITVQRLDAVSRWTPELPPDTNTPVPFPDSAIPEIFTAVLTLADSVKAGQLSPSPRLTSWILRKLPHMRRATATKDAFMAAQIAASLRLIETSPTARPRSALHSFTGFTMAGHDTTATAVAWGVKLLADHIPAQHRLRAALRAALPAAVRERRAPSLAELVEARVPYLDAVVDEVLRLANAIAFVARALVAC
ncbi:putative cytochrome p450 monooxygenase protein [Neofusicoccum parvum UCRNP2]|uniref:Putative cytochrome p450 monooxygenase protein n=1 Tax=Botryosphaeria parva (strain UCR-NP2) TaxID=1287680 RepID=R1G477_BOTPV|nr:putative cytochrome p450 monooxygenase protein [Neofusicoccum parvum UCRNP2]